MKKNFKKLAGMLAIVCLVSFILSFAASAALVEGTYSNTEQQYTAVTNTSGYTGINFTGVYIEPDSESNYALIYADCRGGSTASFETKLDMYFRGMNPSRIVHVNSNDTGSRFLEGRIKVYSNEIVGSASALIEYKCTNKTDANDYWWDYEAGTWRNARLGWE